jgi:CheY-like chemotaxis protein
VNAETLRITPHAAGDLPAPLEFAGCSVLLLGERQPVLPALARQLQRAAIELRELSASGGQRLPGPAPELVFIDLATAPLEAISLARTLRHGGLRAPLVGLTDNGGRLPAYACFSAGLDDLLDLPLPDEELWGCLTRWLRPRRTH